MVRSFPHGRSANDIAMLEGAGTHIFRWDGTSSAGEAVASGIYFYRIVADDRMFTKKMVLTR